MEHHPIYTIGHGTKKISDFVIAIQQLRVDYLIDVRSVPYSKMNPEFNQVYLEKFLEQNGIRYVFMGNTLGGRPTDPSCYNEEGKVDYDKVKVTDFFQKGIERLKNAYSKNISLVIMCSESKPIECHRTKLIGRALFEHRIFLNHIDENGNLKDQAYIINELNKGSGDKALFPDLVESKTTSRKSYL